MMAIYLLALGFSLFSFPLESKASASGCFSPEQDPTLKKLLSPRAEFNETPETIAAIHKMIYDHRSDLDPRLVYYRMIGESMANPYAKNPTSSAYGMFQFLGRPYKSKQTHREKIEALYRARPNESPRLLQVEYYLEQYLAAAKAAADGGYGCKRSKKFKDYSHLEKSAYLGWGFCDSDTLKTELGLCQKVSSYKNGGCRFTTPLYEGNAPPLCPVAGTAKPAIDEEPPAKVKSGTVPQTEEEDFSDYRPKVVADSWEELREREGQVEAGPTGERKESPPPQDFSDFFRGNPKFLSLVAGSAPLRTSPDFSAGRTDNLAGKAMTGEGFVITNLVPQGDSLAVEILKDGRKAWIEVPKSKKANFQFCEDPACVANLREMLVRLQDEGLSPTVMASCGIILDQNGNPVDALASIPLGKDSWRAPSDEEAKELDLLLQAKTTEASRPEKTGDCVADSRSAKRPDFERIPAGPKRKEALVGYLTPFALDLQELTGLPASIFLAQAALETGWGVTYSRADSSNLIGHICQGGGSERTYVLPVKGGTKEVAGTCQKRKSGYYREFGSAQDSVYAYGANLLNANHGYYSNLKSVVNRAHPGTAKWQDVLPELKAYSSDSGRYLKAVGSIIEKNGLAALDSKRLCR